MLINGGSLFTLMLKNAILLRQSALRGQGGVWCGKHIQHKLSCKCWRESFSTRSVSG